MEKRRPLRFFIYTLFALALLGLVTNLTTNTSTFLRSVFIFVGIGATIYLIRYFLFFRHQNTDELKKYRRAAKASQRRRLKTGHKSTTTTKKMIPISKKRTTMPPHLRVIDGKKSNRKGRASL
ncbi:SA1362 family protein [Amphibacillus sediminis]|uniref:SA1362 family protein n=1 Tax=Amphibacillus sediminis TaxID=360185 RepID=UPI00082A4069|nr:SA1362 family protein [Amphibacillus sediminis]